MHAVNLNANQYDFVLPLYIPFQQASEHFKNFGKDRDATTDELEAEFNLSL
jgi:hypothetical protein